MPFTSRTLRLAVLPTLAFLAGACSVSEDDEVQLGRETAAELSQQVPLVRDPAINEYVTTLGRDIASRTSRPNLPWEFHVVDAAEVNAFAVPGGFIYINRGLIERAQRFDELAGVLGHEIGHVVLRHSAEQMEKQGQATGVVTAVCLLTGLCEGQVANAAIAVAGSAWMARHSRSDEAEADSAGIHAVMAAGISPRGIPTFFGTLMRERQRQPTAMEGWFASHPLEEDRVARTEALIDAIPAAELEPLTTDTEGFRAFKARVNRLPPPPRVASPQP